MGMDFNAGTFSNFCEKCNRADYEEYFGAGNRLFKEHVAVSIDAETRLPIYKGVPNLFSKHIENGEYYRGQEALEKWEAVKGCIKEEAYEEVKELLENGDGFIHAWW